MTDLKTFFDFKKAKFEDLHNILDDAKFCWTLPTSIFIDVDQLIASMKEAGLSTKKFEFSSALLNIAGYYRYFFWKHKIRTNITFFCTERIISEDEAINSEIKMLTLIVRNIPGMYSIVSKMPARLVPFALYSKDKFENTIVASYGNFSYLYPFFMNAAPSYTLHLSGKYSSVINSFTKEWLYDPITVLALAGDVPHGIPNIKKFGLVRAEKFCIKNKEKDIEAMFDEDSLKQFKYNKEYYDVPKLIEKYKDEFFTLETHPNLVDYYNKEEVKSIQREYYSVYSFHIPHLFLGE